AVSMASVPIAIHYMKTQPSQRPSAQSQVTPKDSSSSAQDNSLGEAPQQNGSNARSTPAKKMSVAGVIGTLTMIGLASPFLELTEGASGLIGLVILFVGMRFAWKMTAGRGNVKVEGPFQLANAASA
ncbi:MAG TPA: hypothetical protein VJV96_17960, partial [Candidatus Angelobacter sp.]|nr:hypothetical protein [Candidatus Angelobacter sp.]